MVSFEHERLDVYGAALEFLEFAADVRSSIPRGSASIVDQLDRAASSVSLNVAEGAGEFGSKEKRRFYRMALRSCHECAAILDVLRIRRLVPTAVAETGRETLDRIAAMLTKMTTSIQ